MNNLTVCLTIQIKSNIGNIFQFKALTDDSETAFSMSIANKSIILLVSGNKIRIQNENLFNSEQSHVCIQYQQSNGQLNMQLNGVNDLTTNITLTRDVVNTSRLSDSKGVMVLGGGGFKGRIEHFFVYSRWLDETELQSVYRTQKLIKDTVIGWWEFKTSTE